MEGTPDRDQPLGARSVHLWELPCTLPLNPNMPSQYHEYRRGLSEQTTLTWAECGALAKQILRAQQPDMEGAQQQRYSDNLISLAAKSMAHEPSATPEYGERLTGEEV